jgi:hypothetical protein
MAISGIIKLIFKSMPNKKCPKCKSKNNKKSGPFAKIKKEGEPAYKGSSPVYYHCWNCENDWEELE